MAEGKGISKGVIVVREELEKLHDEIDGLREKTTTLAVIVEDVLVTLSRVLEREELFTYEEYANVREALSELREVVEELRTE